MALVHVGRRLTETPLSRRHEQVVVGKGRRKIVEIPWESFDRTRYPEAALSLAAEAQRALAVGEYTAIDLFSRLSSALTSNGAPLDLVSAAARIPEDEARHADYALRYSSLLAGREAVLTFDPAAQPWQWVGVASTELVDRMMLEVSAVGETLAAALLQACLDRAADPVARGVFASILADEVHHARLGWYYLTWRAPQWSLAERQRLADRCGEVIARLEVQFSRGRDAPRGSQKAARALGVLETRGQREALAAVVEGEILPGLDALGFGASHAWAVRQRVAG
jgi:hypothetical protein